MQKYLRREFFLSASIIVLSFVVFGVGVWWYGTSLEKVTKEILVDRLLLKKRTEAIGVLAQFKSEAPVAGAYQKAMDAILPAEDQLLDFPRWIESIARARNLEAGFSFQGGAVPAQEDSAGYIGFTMSVNGSLSDIFGFVKDLELQTPRFLSSIDGFDLHGADAQYQFSSRGRVFFK
ncbi:hypothetical protein C4571_00405 [Candidatus Parcubacteria bacterium]|nr:MAG: hypothetical protein C4571_00405 [Candidatus Parcubacteria bacterium]